jgi:plastocyanin
MPNRILFAMAFASALAFLALGGCSNSSPSSPSYGGGYGTGGGGGGGGGGGTGNQVAIANFAFSPNSLTITKGTTVTWKNNDSVTHTATADSGSFDTGNIASGATSGGVTFNTSGTFTYHCNIHTYMHGTIIVQ